MAQLHNADFLEASSVEAQDILPTSAYIYWNSVDLFTRFLINPYNLLKKNQCHYMLGHARHSIINIIWY